MNQPIETGPEGALAMECSLCRLRITTAPGDFSSLRLLDLMLYHRVNHHGDEQ